MGGDAKLARTDVGPVPPSRAVPAGSKAPAPPAPPALPAPKPAPPAPKPAPPAPPAPKPAPAASDPGPLDVAALAASDPWTLIWRVAQAAWPFDAGRERARVALVLFAFAIVPPLALAPASAPQTGGAASAAAGCDAATLDALLQAVLWKEEAPAPGGSQACDALAVASQLMLTFSRRAHDDPGVAKAKIAEFVQSVRAFAERLTELAAALPREPPRAAAFGRYMTLADDAPELGALREAADAQDRDGAVTVRPVHPVVLQVGPTCLFTSCYMAEFHNALGVPALAAELLRERRVANDALRRKPQDPRAARDALRVWQGLGACALWLVETGRAVEGAALFTDALERVPGAPSCVPGVRHANFLGLVATVFEQLLASASSADDAMFLMLQAPFFADLAGVAVPDAPYLQAILVETTLAHPSNQIAPARQALRQGFGLDFVDVQAYQAQHIAALSPPAVTDAVAWRYGYPYGHALCVVVLERSMHIFDSHSCTTTDAYRTPGEFPADTWRRLKPAWTRRSGTGLILEDGGHGVLTPTGYGFRTDAGYAVQVPGEEFLPLGEVESAWHAFGVDRPSHSMSASPTQLREQVLGALSVAASLLREGGRVTATASAWFKSCPCALMWRLLGERCGAVCLSVDEAHVRVRLLRDDLTPCALRVNAGALSVDPYFDPVRRELETALDKRRCNPVEGRFVLLDPAQSASNAIAQLRLPSADRLDRLRALLLDALLPVSRPSHTFHLPFASGVLDVARRHVALPALTRETAAALVRAVLQLKDTDGATACQTDTPLAGGYAVFWRMQPRAGTDRSDATDTTDTTAAKSAAKSAALLLRVDCQPSRVALWAKRGDEREPRRLDRSAGSPADPDAQAADAQSCEVRGAVLLLPFDAARPSDPGRKGACQAVGVAGQRASSPDARAFLDALAACLAGRPAAAPEAP